MNNLYTTDLNGKQVAITKEERQNRQDELATMVGGTPADYLSFIKYSKEYAKFIGETPTIKKYEWAGKHIYLDDYYQVAIEKVL